MAAAKVEVVFECPECELPDIRVRVDPGRTSSSWSATTTCSRCRRKLAVELRGRQVQVVSVGIATRPGVEYAVFAQ